MKSDVFKKMSSIINERENVFIFGTGRNAFKLHDIFLERNEETKVCAYVDNNPDRCGNVFLGKPVISAEQLRKEITTRDLVILSMSAYEEVEIQLQQMGITQDMMMSIHMYLDIIAEEKIAKIKEKKQNQKIIRVGFLTQEIQSWDKTAPIYEVMKNKENFVPLLFVVPLMDFKTCELTEESHYEVFQRKYPDADIILANEKTDMADYRLDYLFMTAPYDAYYPEKLRSDYLANQTLLCYIPYGYVGAYNFISVVVDRDFFRNIYITFTDTEEVREQLLEYFGNSVNRGNRKILDIGYPSLECISMQEETENGRIMWTPRWSYDARVGGSHFFEYYDAICGIKKKYPQRELVIRPHPMMFDEFIKKGMISEKDAENYRQQIADQDIILDENSDVSVAMENTAILITDYSSLIIQFFMTGKPIIYCQSEIFHLCHDYKKLMEVIYVANNVDEIEGALYEIR